MSTGIAVADFPELARDTAPRLIRVVRKGLVLRPSPTVSGVYGLDLTAGCFHGCGYCHIRGSGRFPGEEKVLFDPFTVDRLDDELEAMEMLPRQVVLSPTSDPLPPLREVRRMAESVVERLLERGIEIVVMTRGRFSRKLIATLAKYPQKAKALIGLTTLDHAISRALEPRAASPLGRVRDVARLVQAGVSVEIRLEPLIPDRTDTRENLLPLFASLARAGARKVVAHSLFLHPSMVESLDAAISPLGWSERLNDQFEEGAAFRIGSLGMTKHLPVEVRLGNLARWITWGAEHGLTVSTGASQNPDLPAGSPR